MEVLTNQLQLPHSHQLQHDQQLQAAKLDGYIIPKHNSVIRLNHFSMATILTIVHGYKRNISISGVCRFIGLRLA